MLPVLLVVLLCCVAVVTASSCDPTKYLCSGKCPPLPRGVEAPKSEAVCSKDPDSDTCICWLLNPSSQLHTLFQCEAKVNDTVSKITCVPPNHCFSPQAEPACLIIMHCQCLLFEQRYQFHKSDSWKRVRAIIHTMKKDDSKDGGHPIEKFQGDVREFSLKHLLFLLGFVIAPLLCWCLLNFFHEGRCRKKPPQPPEACPIPTSRSSTVDNMNNDEQEGSSAPRPASSPSRSASVQSHTFSIQLPTAPEEMDAVLSAEAHHQAQMKCESPPPYCESVDRNYQLDCGPPPAYEDAVRGSDMNIQQVWQSVFIVQPECRENT